MKDPAKILKIVGALLAGISLGVIIVYSYNHYQNDYCTDVVPDTPDIYVYSADMWYADLNRRYASAVGLEPSGDEFSMITYDDIPSVFAMDGVREIYLLDDAELSDFAERIYSKSDDVAEAMPKDVFTYFHDVSGMAGIFEIELGSAPSDGANDICLPRSWAMTHDYPEIGDTVTYNGHEYRLSGYSKNNFGWVSLGSAGSVYYKYDPSTWDEFMERLNRYLVDEDAISEVNMMIVCDEEKSASVQRSLVNLYPASNYTSADFVKVWKDNYNKVFWKDQITFMAVVLAVTAVGEIVLFVVSRRKKRSNG
ncbi:hypothetical protein SAMN02910456_00443 [Ruminococcaceae bacterium YRB3002]|nr:hypothetical protein SAMN02910456_00443 [Ruminococcaceae bacterium YRB3002]